MVPDTDTVREYEVILPPRERTTECAGGATAYLVFDRPARGDPDE